MSRLAQYVGLPLLAVSLVAGGVGCGSGENAKLRERLEVLEEAQREAQREERFGPDISILKDYTWETPMSRRGIPAQYGNRFTIKDERALFFTENGETDDVGGIRYPIKKDEQDSIEIRLDNTEYGGVKVLYVTGWDPMAKEICLRVVRELSPDGRHIEYSSGVKFQRGKKTKH